jgi:hypothetical protein
MTMLLRTMLAGAALLATERTRARWRSSGRMTASP